jgi:hypothetical protein
MERLRQWAAVEFDSNPASVSYRRPEPAEEVELTVPAVRHALEAFLAGEASAQELRDWAIFITLSGRFSTPQAPAHDEYWYDPLWDAVHDLASPEVHGPITSESVTGLLHAFERFESRSDDRAV